MVRTVGRHGTTRCQRWVLCLGLVVACALLAHDALMAGAGAHAGPVVSHPSSAHHASVDRSEPTGGAGFARTDDSVPAAPAESDVCGQMRTVLADGARPDVAGDAAAGITPLDGVGRLDSAERWSEPTRPPSSRRAMIQVYRE